MRHSLSLYVCGKVVRAPRNMQFCQLAFQKEYGQDYYSCCILQRIMVIKWPELGS